MSPGLWEVGRALQPRACPMSQDEAEPCQAVLSEIRGTEDPISGRITHWPKSLLAKDEVLTCLAWLHFSVRNACPHLNSPKSCGWPGLSSRQCLLAMDTFEKCRVSGEAGRAWDETTFHVDLRGQGSIHSPGVKERDGILIYI